ncbi:MAG: MAPEG family protein [Stenotrophobium sp.]
MINPAILYPVFALALWTGLVLLLMPIARIRAVRRREIVPDDFKYGESASVPPYVRIPNRNYMNLLELPVLFYVGCLLIYVTGGATLLMVSIAWAYVGLRVVHSAIHLTYNHVIHRLGAFALSNGVLVVLWVLAAAQVVSHTGA